MREEVQFTPAKPFYQGLGEVVGYVHMCTYVIYLFIYVYITDKVAVSTLNILDS